VDVAGLQRVSWRAHQQQIVRTPVHSVGIVMAFYDVVRSVGLLVPGHVRPSTLSA
jgi:hypothetical protein